MLNKPLLLDEKDILEKLFEFNHTIRNKIYNLTVVGEANQVFAVGIIKYLLHVKDLSPYEVEDYIRKYMVIFVYSLLKSKCDKFDLDVPHFNEILERNISVDDLSNENFEDTNVFTHLFFKRDKYQYQQQFRDLKNKILEWGYYDLKKTDKIMNILKKDNNYFIEKRDRFDDLKEYNSRDFDEMIAETLTDDEFFNFTIQIDDDNMDAFNSNFIETKTLDDIKKIRKLIFGYMVNDIFNNNNKSFTSPVKLIAAKHVKLYLGMKNASSTDKSGHSVMLFIDTDINNKNTINPNLINPFNFMFNGISYSFSKEGIKKI